VATFLNDTFTEAGGGTVALTSHTGETGATWAAHPDNAGTTQVIATSDRIWNSTASQNHIFYCSGTSANANYAITAVMRILSSQVHTNAILGRLQTGSNDYYFVQFNGFAAPDEWNLSKVVTGSETTLDTYVGSNSTATDYTLVFTLDGTSLSCTFDGVEQLSATDSDISAAGRVGVGGYDKPSNTSNGCHTDSISAADIGGGGGGVTAKKLGTQGVG
jgi:hypothetical protein